MTAINDEIFAMNAVVHPLPALAVENALLVSVALNVIHPNVGGLIFGEVRARIRGKSARGGIPIVAVVISVAANYSSYVFVSTVVADRAPFSVHEHLHASLVPVWVSVLADQPDASHLENVCRRDQMVTEMQLPKSKQMDTTNQAKTFRTII